MQTRLLIWIAFIAVAAGALLAWVLIDDAQGQLDQFRLAQAKHQARSLAAASVDGLAAEDYELLTRWTSSAIPTEHYAYAALVRPDGRILTHTDLKRVGHRLPSEAALTTPLALPDSYEGRRVMKVLHPVLLGKQHFANAHVAYYLDHKLTLQANTWVKLAGVLMMMLIPLLLSTYLVIRWITQPVVELTQAVTDMSPQALQSISVSSIRRRDEIGALARAFNALTGRLADAYQKLQAANADLEQRVTERTALLSQANQGLLDSEARLAAILDNIGEGIITVDLKGRIKSFNHAATTLFGYTPEEFAGRDFATLVPELEGAPPQSPSLKQAASQRAPRELIGRRKSGETFPMELVWSELQFGQEQLLVAIARDITERRAMLAQLHFAAEHDLLTGIYNRKYLQEELNRVISRAQRGECSSFALLFIDLDNFKTVNDTLGHAAGDRVLVEVVALLRERARKGDLIARLGGDEFAVLLYDTDPAQAELAAEAFRAKLEEYSYREGTVRVDVGCSIGIALIDQASASLADVIAQADAACYQAKRAGRNAVRRFKPEDA